MVNPTRTSILHQKVEKVLKIAINAEMVKFTRNNEYTRPPYSTVKQACRKFIDTLIWPKCEVNRY